DATLLAQAGGIERLLAAPGGQARAVIGDGPVPTEPQRKQFFSVAPANRRPLEETHPLRVPRPTWNRSIEIMSKHTRFPRIVMAALATSIALVCVALSLPTRAGAQGSSNLPWFPSLAAFEHYDSGRTKLFEHADFTGSLTGANAVDVRISPDTYPTPY